MALVYDLDGPVVVPTDRGKVPAQESLLPLDVRPVLHVLLPEVALSAPDKLFAVKIEIKSGEEDGDQLTGISRR